MPTFDWCLYSLIVKPMLFTPCSSSKLRTMYELCCLNINLKLGSRTAIHYYRLGLKLDQYQHLS